MAEFPQTPKGPEIEMSQGQPFISMITRFLQKTQLVAALRGAGTGHSFCELHAFRLQMPLFTSREKTELRLFKLFDVPLEEWSNVNYRR